MELLYQQQQSEIIQNQQKFFMDLLQNFRNKQIIRSQIICPQELNIFLDHCQYAIHTQFDKNSRHIYKFKKRKHQINPFFKNAFQTLNRQEKVLLYIRMIEHIENLSKGIDIPPKITQVKMKPIQGLCECRSFNLKIWKLKNIRVDRTRHEVMVQNQKDHKIKTYDLRDYLLRKSKNKSKYVLVLETINDKPHQKSRQVHISFQDAPALKFWFNLIKQQVEVCQWLNIKQMYQNQQNQAHQNQIHSKNSNDLMNTSITSINSVNKKENDSRNSQLQQDQLMKQEERLYKQEQQIFGRKKTFIDHLVDDDCVNFEEFFDVIDNQTDKEVQSKKNLDFFHKLMPDYQLDHLMELADYQTAFIDQNKIHILQNLTNPYRFKMIITFPLNIYSSKQIFCMISEPRYALKINDNIQQGTIKTLLKSENSAIIYLSLKAYNKFYRSRDFVFVRHAFIHDGNYYLVDKSLDNINFPPFMTLVRGQISIVWGVIQDPQTRQIKLVGDIVILNSGLLNDEQQTNLSLRFLTGFKNIFKQELDPTIESSMFDIDWNIDKKEVNKQFNEIRNKRKTIKIEKQKLLGNQFSEKKNQMNFVKKSSSTYEFPSSSPQRLEEQKYKICQKKQITQIINFQKQKKILPTSEKSIIFIKQQVFQKSELTQQKSQQNKINLKYQKQINPKQPETELQVIKKLDKDGFVIVNKGYIKKKFSVSPIQKQQYIEYKKIKGHAIWKGDWIHDTKVGGIIFINQKKIEDQKGVLKFILTKIGKNILSGKSILNISLPVDIFSTESNIQRLLLSMGYGPRLLENLNKKKLLEKLSKVVAFGLSNSVLYISIEKPFNPILGETFQCWINGCPGYGEQISHHPPITALMFMGRGYRVACQLQSKVELHMNSGCGTNQGIYKVLFDDGTQICFMTPGGEISGLTYGQRKLNLVGKSYYWIEKQKIFLQLNFDAGKKGFFSKQQKTNDYFEGKVYEVTPEFFKIFPKTKKREPSQKQKIKELGSFQGIWHKYLKFNDQQIFHFDKVVPLKIQYECNSLLSDSNWREDIEYRRLNKITKAQTQKQRLQVLQRNDRKFRQKHKKK